MPNAKSQLQLHPSIHPSSARVRAFYPISPVFNGVCVPDIANAANEHMNHNHHQQSSNVSVVISFAARRYITKHIYISLSLSIYSFCRYWWPQRSRLSMARHSSSQHHTTERTIYICQCMSRIGAYKQIIIIHNPLVRANAYTHRSRARSLSLSISCSTILSHSRCLLSTLYVVPLSLAVLLLLLLPTTTSLSHDGSAVCARAARARSHGAAIVNALLLFPNRGDLLRSPLY